MCMSTIYYPLVYDYETKKNKVLFSLPTDIKTFDNLEYFNSFVSGYYAPLFSSHNERFIKLVKVPCGQCQECLNSRAREWVSRLIFETKQRKGKDCYFITLTYDNDNLPFNNSLVKEHLSSFNKKLRTYLDRKNLSSNFKFYSVGEYGSTTYRPHYHGIYFGLPLNDLKLYNYSNGKELYNSDFLTNIWNKGFVVVASVEPASIAYVARYSEKKQQLNKYQKELFKKSGLVPEFSLMSRRPGIGLNYDYKKDLLNGKFDFYHNGVKITYSGSILKRLKTKSQEDGDNELYECLEHYFNSNQDNTAISCSNKIMSALVAFDNLNEYNDSSIKNDTRKRGTL